MKRFGIGNLFQRDEEGGENQPGETVAETTPAERRKPNPGTTVLVVDDSKTIQTVLGKMLSHYGYETLSAFDGDSAVELAREHKPALILMDVVMPGQNGFQATRAIRKDSDPQVANLPVIMMSGNAQPTEEFWSVKIKANGFVAKPFSDEELLDRIEQLIFTDQA